MEVNINDVLKEVLDNEKDGKYLNNCILTFSTNFKMKDVLFEISRNERRSFSSLVRNIITDYLKENGVGDES